MAEAFRGLDVTLPFLHIRANTYTKCYICDSSLTDNLFRYHPAETVNYLITEEFSS